MEQKSLYNRKPVTRSFIMLCFIRALHRKGKLTKARAVWKSIIKGLLSREKSNPWPLILAALRRVAPLVDLRDIRIARSKYQVPTPIRTKRSISLAANWIIESAGGRHKGGAISSEIVGVCEGVGKSLKLRQNWQATARKKMRYVRYRWH